MIFSVPEAVAFLSRFVTLRPGDLVCMGTPGGVGDTTQTDLKPGDVVEASIEKLGTEHTSRSAFTIEKRSERSGRLRRGGTITRSLRTNLLRSSESYASEKMTY